MAKIVHRREGVIVAEYPLEQGRIMIGRRPECDICIDDITVSGNHASVTVKPSGYMEGLNDIIIEDQGSTNGTIVNGRNVKRHFFKHGEIAFIGSHELTLIDENTQCFETTQVILPGS